MGYNICRKPDECSRKLPQSTLFEILKRGGQNQRLFHICSVIIILAIFHYHNPNLTPLKISSFINPHSRLFPLYLATKPACPEFYRMASGYSLAEVFINIFISISKGLNMKKTLLASTIVAVLSLSAFTSNLYAETYSGGNGEPNNPYEIATVADWQELMATPTDWNKSFLLMADIDLAGVNLVPVGNSNTKFNGVFDGNYHIVSNAAIDQLYGDHIGIFGYAGNGEIMNLIAENVNITARRWVGGVVGYNESGSIISCYSSGVVTGNEKSNFDGNYTGGLVGYNGGSVGSCWLDSYRERGRLVCRWAGRV